MGNDIPGYKVYQNPEYVSVPLSESDPVELAISHPDVFGPQARKKDEIMLVKFATALSEDKLPPLLSWRMLRLVSAPSQRSLVPVRRSCCL